MFAAVVSAWFCVRLLSRFTRGRSPQQLAWGIALGAFALASASAAAGMSRGWSPALFRNYYYFGAIVNVPVLALGTLYLYLPRPAGHALALVVAGLAGYAALVVTTAPVEPLAGAGWTIPAGSEVMADEARALSRYYSYSGFVIVLAGALWSMGKLARRPGETARRLMQGNGLIAAGTTIVAVASAFARQGEGSVFAVGLALGVTVMYLGFNRASVPRRVPSGHSSVRPVPGDPA